MDDDTTTTNNNNNNNKLLFKRDINRCQAHSAKELFKLKKKKKKGGWICSEDVFYPADNTFAEFLYMIHSLCLYYYIYPHIIYSNCIQIVFCGKLELHGRFYGGSTSQYSLK
jgi:NAD-dependent oxidoreductase involved in siderophore biosynthesis